MSWTRYNDASMHPPAHNPPRRRSKSGVDHASPPWVLLDKAAYIAGGSYNNTTAVSRTRDDAEIRVTFSIADPPLVSHFRVSCTSMFGTEPSILYAEANLVLLHLVHGNPSNITNPEMHDFYVYDADGQGQPSLTLLPHPPPNLFPWDRCYYFHERQVGLLRYRSTNSGGGGFCLTPHAPNPYDYIVAALCTRDTFPVSLGLYAYDSKTKVWSCKPASFPDGKLPDAVYRCDKVITIGGEAGTMGWVSLMRGIIICDVLQCNNGKDKELRYIPVPPPIRPANTLDDSGDDSGVDDSGAMYRDIAVVGTRIKYVEVEMHVRPGSGGADGSFTIDGWTAVIWSRPAKSVKESSWRKDHELHAHEVSFVDGKNNTVPGFELLPKLLDDTGKPQPTLERIHVGHPKLSLCVGDNTLYLMAKVNRWYDKAWVIAVDVKSKSLQGVVEFGGAPRCTSFINAYSQSQISAHLNVQGAKGHLKRPGMSLQPGSSHKKPEIPLHVQMALQHHSGGQDPRKIQHSFSGQMQQLVNMEGANHGEHEDSMDLE